LNDKNSKYENI